MTPDNAFYESRIKTIEVNTTFLKKSLYDETIVKKFEEIVVNILTEKGYDATLGQRDLSAYSFIGNYIKDNKSNFTTDGIMVFSVDIKTAKSSTSAKVSLDSIAVLYWLYNKHGERILQTDVAPTKSLDRQQRSRNLKGITSNGQVNTIHFTYFESEEEFLNKIADWVLHNLPPYDSIK